MARKVAPVLSDILEAIEIVERATAGKTFEQFQDDRLLCFGVQRAIEIISEATRHIPDNTLALRPEIPWRKIRGTGSVLRHEYHRIADDVIWAVVVRDLAPLKTAVLAIRDQLSE
jgi:uncharacterized protein with HEPN domain